MPQVEPDAGTHPLKPQSTFSPSPLSPALPTVPEPPLVLLADLLVKKHTTRTHCFALLFLDIAKGFPLSAHYFKSPGVVIPPHLLPTLYPRRYLATALFIVHLQNNPSLIADHLILITTHRTRTKNTTPQRRAIHLCPHTAASTLPHCAK